MVILLEILNTTQPNLIPRQAVSEEYSWENREKPLTKPERAAKGALYYPIVVSDALHVPDVNVDPYSAYESSAPTSACVPPSVLLPTKKLSRPLSVASSSSSDKSVSRWEDYHNKNSMPGFRNPAFQDEISDDDIVNEMLILNKSPYLQSGHTELISPSKALPKHIIQSPTTKGGVFDSKESADSGISKGSMIHQNSNEEARDDYCSSPNSDGSPINQADLMEGRSALDATTRRRIFHQESTKNRTNTIQLDDKQKESADIIVIVHRSSDGNDEIHNQSDKESSASSFAQNNNRMSVKSESSSSFVSVNSPEDRKSKSSRANSPFFIIQSDNEEATTTDTEKEKYEAIDVNSNLKKSYKEEDESGDFQNDKGLISQPSAASDQQMASELNPSTNSVQRPMILPKYDSASEPYSIDRPIRYQRYLSAPPPDDVRSTAESPAKNNGAAQELLSSTSASKNPVNQNEESLC